jgi:hypothetical protein
MRGAWRHGCKKGNTVLESNQDKEQLRLLSVFHYVVAGIMALFSLFPLLHLAIGIAIVAGGFGTNGNGEAPPQFVGWFFIVFASSMILCGFVMALCIALAGNRLANNRSYRFCLITACIQCIFMPFGTVLGIFTIIVLMRPSVKQLFEATHENEPE